MLERDGTVSLTSCGQAGFSTAKRTQEERLLKSDKSSKAVFGRQRAGTLKLVKGDSSLLNARDRDGLHHFIVALGRAIIKLLNFSWKSAQR
jgi:hypothetical protein